MAITITDKFFNMLLNIKKDADPDNPEISDLLPATWENKLDGKWEDTFGWHIIGQPELGNPSCSDFNFRVDQMRETITFSPLGVARNIGVTGEAGFWRGIKYQIGVHTPDGDEIHQEMGHFLLGVEEDPDSDNKIGFKTPEKLVGKIIRQASIPRANAMMTLGKLIANSVSDFVRDNGDKPFYSAHPKSEDSKFQSVIDDSFKAVRDEVMAKGGPNFETPSDWLSTILADNVVAGTKDWEFGFRNDENPSQMANGQRVVNPVSIGNLLSDFWIGQRTIDGTNSDILQYAQRVDIGFNKTEWPHVAVNTLIKQ
ncbi:MAG: hypothetical protein COA42_13695 [Alteromonadaceae bacterium]|nr:MAG: hypothetical protein COA42_13695 [Alteromonadaceae bacterium]